MMEIISYRDTFTLVSNSLVKTLLPKKFVVVFSPFQINMNQPVFSFSTDKFYFIDTNTNAEILTELHPGLIFHIWNLNSRRLKMKTNFFYRFINQLYAYDGEDEYIQVSVS